MSLLVIGNSYMDRQSFWSLEVGDISGHMNSEHGILTNGTFWKPREHVLSPTSPFFPAHASMYRIYVLCTHLTTTTNRGNKVNLKHQRHGILPHGAKSQKLDQHEITVKASVKLWPISCNLSTWWMLYPQKDLVFCSKEL